MFKINLLENPHFVSGTNNWTIGSGISRDINTIYGGYPTLKLNIEDKTVDEEVGILSDKILVRPEEIYSGSVFCKTSDYTLFDGTDPQITLYIYGYDSLTDSTPTTLGSIGKNKANFPAQDWFRLELENISIPTNIHYVSIYITIKRNGIAWLSYPCLELNNVVSDYEAFETDVYNTYYNDEIYNEIYEIEELTKTQNISLNELNEKTEEVVRNFYVLTADESGISNFEDEYNISSDSYTEGLEFRRSRLYNRTTTFLPYTFTFLKNKLDSLLGEDNYTAYIDFDTYTIYLEYMAQNELWDNEISITIAGIKPCNMTFINTPLISSKINITEEVNLNSFTFNYNLDGTWSLGTQPFADLQNLGIIKMAEFSSIQAKLLGDIAQFTTEDVDNVLLSDGTTSFVVTDFASKSKVGDYGLVEYVVSSAITGLTEITNIKLRDKDNNILTNSVVYVQLDGQSSIIKHKFIVTEG